MKRTVSRAVLEAPGAWTHRVITAGGTSFHVADCGPDSSEYAAILLHPFPFDLVDVARIHAARGRGRGAHHCGGYPRVWDVRFGSRRRGYPSARGRCHRCCLHAGGAHVQRRGMRHGRCHRLDAGRSVPLFFARHYHRLRSSPPGCFLPLPPGSSRSPVDQHGDEAAEAILLSVAYPVGGSRHSAVGGTVLRSTSSGVGDPLSCGSVASFRRGSRVGDSACGASSVARGAATS